MRLVRLNMLVIWQQMQKVTQTLPRPLLPSLLALRLQEHGECPVDVTALNSGVCIRDDTDISQAFNIEVTTSM